MKPKDQLIQVIGRHAQRRVGNLACQLIRSESKDREMILDEMQFQRWLADTCQDCLIGSF